MKQRMPVAALVIGLVTLGGGTAIAQGPDPTLAPAPSYQPMPAADPLAAVNGHLDLRRLGGRDHRSLGDAGVERHGQRDGAPRWDARLVRER